MEELNRECAGPVQPDNITNLQPNSTTDTATSQRQRILAHLLEHGSITTLEGRNKLFCMGFAARIWELKHNHNHNIVTAMEPVSLGSKVKIARYTLLEGVHHDEK